jgi:hypothetical protein
MGLGGAVLRCEIFILVIALRIAALEIVPLLPADFNLIFAIPLIYN